MARRKLPKINRVYCFFALFCTVYFLESIGGVYMVSAVQSIERQFQIPSKMSGLMISAGDFGYIPTVAFISYMGSKGNRARWIGGGCVLIAVANLLIATPNFLFRAPIPELNLSVVREKLTPPAYLAYANVTAEQLLDYAPVKEKMPPYVRERLLNNLHGVEKPDYFDMLLEDMFSDVITETTTNPVREKREAPTMMPSNPDLDELKKGADMVKTILMEGKNATEFFDFLKQFIRRKRVEGPHAGMIQMVQRSANAPFGICNAIVNELKQMIEDMKCARNPTNTGPFLIIFMALFFLGIGRTMPWSLGVPLIDDNVKRKNLPVYFAGMFFIRILGPILGFSIGSFCNRLYFNLNPPDGLSPRDPTWIGAWWLGFLIIFCILIGPAVALVFYPNPESKAADDESESDEGIDPETALQDKNNRVPKKKRKRELALVDRHVRKTSDGQTLVPVGVCDKIMDFKKSIVEVIKSPIYTGALIGRILDVLAFKGFMVFLPKYLENHYGIPQYEVQKYMAMFGVVGFAIGMLSGSFVMRKFKLEGRKAALFVAFCSLFAVVLSSLKIFLGCHSVVNSVGLQGQPTAYNYTTECNAACFCNPVKLFPVCDKAGNPYYSPCHAGCRNVNVTDFKTFDMHFTECQCTKSGDKEVKRDWCKDDCKEMIVIYFGLVIIAGICGGLGVIPGVLIILRAVPPAHRSISLGFSGFLVSLCATLPSPVIWGFIIDSACLVWETTCTGKGGSCTIYEPNTLRIRMHVFYGILRGLALLLDVWVWYFAKDLKLMTEDEEKDDKNQNANGTHPDINGDDIKTKKIVQEAAMLAVESQETDDLPRKMTL